MTDPAAQAHPGTSTNATTATTSGPDVEPAPRLYVVYLGGDVVPGRMGEDHEVVLVAAGSVKEARRRAKRKWNGVGRPHVDAIAEVHRVDGHTVELVPGGPEGDGIVVDPTYVP